MTWRCGERARQGFNACCLAIVGLAACKPPTSVVPEDNPSGSATPAVPTHEALDVPVINAARGEDFLGTLGPQVVWTGTEAALLYKEPGWMAPLWVGQMDGRGTLLDRRRVAPDRRVGENLYPVWVDGTVAAVFTTELTHDWIRIGLNGTVRAAAPLSMRNGRSIDGASGVMHASGRFAVLSYVPARGPRDQQALELHDSRGRHIGSVPLCEFVGDVTATDWGYAAECIGPFSPDQPDAPTSKVLGIRGDKIAWELGGLPSGRYRTLGSDGQRVLLVSAAGKGGAYPVTTQVLDRDGSPEAAPITTQSYAPESSGPLIWTGKEFATIAGPNLIRYASDGRPLGVWRLEPRCDRAFSATGLAWTGTAYLVLGSWTWTECIDQSRDHYDDEHFYPQPDGLTWDPATDAIVPPDAPDSIR